MSLAHSIHRCPKDSPRRQFDPKPNRTTDMTMSSETVPGGASYPAEPTWPMPLCFVARCS